VEAELQNLLGRLIRIWKSDLPFNQLLIGSAGLTQAELQNLFGRLIRIYRSDLTFSQLLIGHAQANYMTY
jgi:hypothetical protein